LDIIEPATKINVDGSLACSTRPPSVGDPPDGVDQRDQFFTVTEMNFNLPITQLGLLHERSKDFLSQNAPHKSRYLLLFTRSCYF